MSVKIVFAPGDGRLLGAQIIGYEGDVGAAQVGHHHHVRGIGTDGEDAHDHGHHHHHHED